MIKVKPTNRIVNSPAYPKILSQYNDILKNFGRVNNKKFYEDVIKKEIPSYALQSWYEFVKRFKTEKGLMEACPVTVENLDNKIDQENSLAVTILSNQEATAKLIQSTLNVSAEASKRLLEHPEELTDTDRKLIEIGFKAMKAQDSRIHAIKSIREDGREAAKFDRAFDNAAY
jgi:hypothetical protein